MGKHSEDSDEMLHSAAFHLSLHCEDKNNLEGQKYKKKSEILTCDPSNI